MKNWEQLFQPHILCRGEAYYEEGRVEDLTFSQGTYTATVYGTDDYTVEILTCGEIVEAMDCTCPYAQDGRNCKHMAAVLYAIENRDTVPNSFKKEVLVSPAQLINAMSEAEVRSFLTELARNDPSIYRALALRFGKIASIDQKELLLAEIDSITETYMDYNNEIRYEDAYSYAMDLSSFLREKPMTLLQSDGPQMVLEVAFYAMEEYCLQEVDDSDGGTCDIEGAICNICEELLQRCTPQQKDEIFAYLRQYKSAKSTHWMIEGIVNDILDTFFNEPSFAEQKLEMVEEDLHQAQCSDFSWKLESLLTKKYLLLRKLPDRNAAFVDFQKQHWKSVYIQKAEIQALIQECNWGAAIFRLLESRRLDSENQFLAQEYTEQLIEIYEQQGNLGELKEELFYHVRHFSQQDLSLLLKLKELLTANEWISLRTQYLSRKNEFQRLKLMEHEGLWEELMDVMLHSPSLALLQIFDKSLQPRFPDEFNCLYVQQLKLKAEHCSTRKEYWGLMQDLKQLSGYQNGSVPAKKLAAQWRILYRRRSAMLDELNKAGF